MYNPYEQEPQAGNISPEKQRDIYLLFCLARLREARAQMPVDVLNTITTAQPVTEAASLSPIQPTTGEDALASIRSQTVREAA